MNAVSPLEVARIKGGHTCLDKAPLSWKEKLAYLAYRIKQGPQADLPLAHIFEGGLYVREMFIPKGSVFLGREHLLGHRCELVAGRILLIGEHGRKELGAPAFMHTVPGYQMTLYAITDVVGRTYHPNPQGLTDYKVLEDSIFAPAADTLALGAQVAERAEALGLLQDNILGYSQ
jgi:hypothetical protein